MSTHSKTFNNLTPVHQRSLHELYLTRHSVLPELSEETKNFLVDNPEIVREEFGSLFERDPFDFRDSNVLFYCPITRAVSDIQSSTPPPGYSSDSEDSAENVEEMASSDSKRKQKKTKKNENISDDNENTDYSNNEEIDGNDHIDPIDTPENVSGENRDVEPKVVPLGRRGFNGQLAVRSNDNSVYVSNTPKVRLEDSQTITHDLVKRFVAQMRRGDFKGTQ